MLVFTLTGCDSYRSDLHQDVDEHKKETVDLPVYLKGTYAAVKKINRKKSDNGAIPNNESEVFHGYIVQTKWTELSESELMRVFKCFTDSNNFDDVTYGCFEPGIALKIETNRGKFDVLVCLMCSTIHIISKNGSRSRSLSELGLDRWKAFYLDNYILKIPEAVGSDLVPK